MVGIRKNIDSKGHRRGDLMVEHRVARFLPFWPAVSWNWWLNRGITFSERQRQPFMRQWAKFVVSSLLGFSMNVGGYTALTSFVDVFARHRLLAFFCSISLGSLSNFLVANLHVYPQRSASKRNPERGAGECSMDNCS